MGADGRGEARVVNLDDLRLAVALKLNEIEGLLPEDYKLTLVARHRTDAEAHIVLMPKDEDESAVMVALRTLVTDREFDKWKRSARANGTVLGGAMLGVDALITERDQANARFAVLWSFLQWVRGRDWTLDRLDRRATELHDEGPAEIGINVVQQRDVAEARARALEARLAVGRQMATVIYNVAQTGNWERAKQPLIELRQAWDRVAAEAAAPLDAPPDQVGEQRDRLARLLRQAVNEDAIQCTCEARHGDGLECVCLSGEVERALRSVPCDGNHAAPRCAHPQCWRR